MDCHDPLAQVDRQLDELRVLARRLGDRTTLLSTARLQLLLTAVSELREQDAVRIPGQRQP